MAVLDDLQFSQLVAEVKEKIQADSQGVGEVPVTDTLDGVNSLPALKGDAVVEAPLELLSRPAVEAAGRVDEAIASALDTAEHPTYIGEDNYVYVWDKANKTYNKTAIYVRGESFSISKVYASVEDMEADTEHGLKEGDFVLVNTDDVENPDNAKLYVVGGDGKFSFLVDMSGAIGFTGKTPQLIIGTISVGDNRKDASATLSADGVDDDGNPKYLLNLRIPALTLDDLTEEEVKLLQSPANEMIAQLKETDDAVKEAEEGRVAAENLRAEAETARAEAEEARDAAEQVREENEASRKTEETVRKSAETTRINNENVRQENETGRVSAENRRVTSENARNTAEQARAQAETTRSENEAERKTSEQTRQNNEATRQANEAVRVNTENARVSAESVRKDNELTRQGNENIRQTNEQARVAAENQRAEDYDGLREDILTATENANNAAEESRNTPTIKDGTWWIWNVEQDAYVDTGSPATSRSPQIQNGTWWTWDDANEVYADTGQSVNADYTLTREKIEGVFQGNVDSHWHDRYVDKVEGKQLSAEDFTTEEKEKLAGLENFDPTGLQEDIKGLQEAMPTKVSELENDKEYVTATELADEDYATNTSLTEGLGRKQDKNLYLTNVAASEWVLEGVYKDFEYRCDILLEGVTEAMVAEVVFGVEESSSGDYAPVCETGDGVLTIWGATDKAIIIPTVIINM